MKKFFLILSICVIGLYGCESYKDYYKLDEQYLARRQLETRFFETNNEGKILNACAQVVQDLEFIVNKTDTKLGLITGYKKREATSLTSEQKALVIGLGILAKSLGGDVVHEEAPIVEENYYIEIVTTKSRDKKGYNVRVEFARMTKDRNNRTHYEKIEDKKYYTDFFEKLSKSLFLTANDL